MTERQLVNIIKYSPILVLPLIIIIIFILEIINFKKSFEENYNRVSNYLIEKEEKLLEKNSTIAIEILEYNSTLNGQKIDGNIIFDLFKNINKKTNDYFFIFDTDGKVIVHSYLRHLEGQILKNSEVEHYKYATNKIIDKNNDSTYIEYYWQNPTTNKLEKRFLS